MLLFLIISERSMKKISGTHNEQKYFWEKFHNKMSLNSNKQAFFQIINLVL